MTSGDCELGPSDAVILVNLLIFLSPFLFLILVILMIPYRNDKNNERRKIKMKQANHGSIDNKQLLTLIERIEKLNEETAAIAADIKEIYIEARSAGYDPKYVRQMIRLRKLDPDELDESDELTKMYRTALGI